jgi:hypothetical protein
MVSPSDGEEFVRWGDTWAGAPRFARAEIQSSATISAGSGKRPSRTLEKISVSPSKTSNWFDCPTTACALRPVCAVISAARLAARGS